MSNSEDKDVILVTGDEDDFVVILDHFEPVDVQCPQCGQMFFANWSTGENVMLDEQFHGVMAVCPICNLQQR